MNVVTFLASVVMTTLVIRAAIAMGSSQEGESDVSVFQWETEIWWNANSMWLSVGEPGTYAEAEAWRDKMIQVYGPDVKCRIVAL